MSAEIQTTTPTQKGVPLLYGDADTAKCCCCTKKTLYKILVVVATALAILSALALIGTLSPISSWMGQTFGGTALFFASKLATSPLVLSRVMLIVSSFVAVSGLIGIFSERSKAKEYQKCEQTTVDPSTQTDSPLSQSNSSLLLGNPLDSIRDPLGDGDQ